MSTASPGSPTVGLGRFIKENRFVVPSHQRDFSWTLEYVREFLKDIEDAVALNRTNYFCGLMVFTSDSPVNYKVLDGQQRLATTLMLFSAIRNWLSPYSEFAEESKQVSDYLGSKDLVAAKVEPKLTLTNANNAAFQAYVTASVPLTDMEKALRQKTVGHRSETLLKAVIAVNKHITTKADTFSSPDAAKDYFVRLLLFLTHKVEIVRFALNTDAAAYTIFETLNDRGLELSPLDLVKNYLFSHAEKHRAGSLTECEERWTEMMALLSSSRADSFLRAFWSSRHGKPEGAKLFTAFKKSYSKPDVLYDLSVDLRRDAERYAALFNSEDAIWAGYSPKARGSIVALGVMGFSQAYPMILSALDKFSKPEMQRLLWLVECVAVRHQLIGKGRPGRVESLGGKAAKDIYDGKLTTASGVFASIRELYVSDDEFRLAFETHEESSSKKVRYLLAGLEVEAVSRDSATLDHELTPYSVTVEHIFPRSKDGEWKVVADADAQWDDRTVFRLGNLCLLPGINHSLGNKPFSQKKAAYAKSTLKLTKELNEYETWGRAEINIRQKHLAKLAVSAWHFQ